MFFTAAVVFLEKIENGAWVAIFYWLAVNRFVISTRLTATLRYITEFWTLRQVTHFRFHLFSYVGRAAEA